METNFVCAQWISTALEIRQFRRLAAMLLYAVNTIDCFEIEVMNHYIILNIFNNSTIILLYQHFTS